MERLADARPVKGAYEVVTLAASAARTADGNTQSAPSKLAIARAYCFVLDVTVAASAVDDTIDVYVQTLLDGTNWYDVVRFTQVLGNGGAKRFVSKIAVDLATAEYETGTGLAAAAVRNLAGDAWAVRWDVTNGAGTHSFTFSVTGEPM